MSAQTSVTTIGNILVMHSFLTDISTGPVSFRRSAPTVVQTHVPAIRKTAEVGFGASPNSCGFVKMLSDYPLRAAWPVVTRWVGCWTIGNAVISSAWRG